MAFGCVTGKTQDIIFFEGLSDAIVAKQRKGSMRLRLRENFFRIAWKAGSGKIPMVSNPYKPNKLHYKKFQR